MPVHVETHVAALFQDLQHGIAARMVNRLKAFINAL